MINILGWHIFLADKMVNRNSACKSELTTHKVLFNDRLIKLIKTTCIINIKFD
jgi:hypothetical protein